MVEIKNDTYLSYLLQSYKIEELKQVCRDYAIKGYSNLTKQQLITFILGAFSEEEIDEYIQQYELEIIDREFSTALSIIRKSKPERPVSLKVVNEQLGEIEVQFKGMKWTTETFLCLNSENINNPEWDCDCITGSNNGFCPHFWVCFLFCYKKGFFSLDEWTLTPLPSSFSSIIKPCEI